MLHWLVALLIAALSGPASVDVTFAGHPDGPPAGFVLYDNSADVGYNPAPDAGLHISGGALQTGASAAGLAAGYAQVHLSGPVTRIGAEFSFTAGDAAGSIALPVWSQPFNDSRNPDPKLSRVPDSPLHVVVSRGDWAYQVYEGGERTSLAAGVFSPPLPAGTPLRLEVVRAGDTATLDLPNGRVVTVTDPRVAGPGRYACFEAFVMNAATMSHPLMTRVWADTN